MKLEEKITLLRKQKGWSQEELAFRLDVSRQAVSKWEMGASLPEVDKILKVSELFNCSTDYLLKEDALESLAGETDEEIAPKKQKGAIQVRDEEVESYLQTTKIIAWRIALGVALCICSPTLLFVLLGLADAGRITNSAANAIGIPVLCLFVVLALPFFIYSGLKVARFEWLENKEICLSESKRAEMKERKGAFLSPFAIAIACGIALCVLSVIPLIVTGALNQSDAIMMYALSALFPLAAGGVFLFVRFGLHWSAFELFDAYNRKFNGHILDTDISVEVKGVKESAESLIESIFWSLVLAGYLLWSFLTGDWGITWVVWPLAGILSSAISSLVKLMRLKKKNEKEAGQVRDEQQKSE